MSYQTLLRELAPDLNPAGVDAPALRYPQPFAARNLCGEAKLAANLEAQSPGILRKIAESMGIGDDFAKWEASHAA